MSDFEKGMEAGKQNNSLKEDLDHLDDQIEKNHPKESDDESSD